MLFIIQVSVTSSVRMSSSTYIFLTTGRGIELLHADLQVADSCVENFTNVSGMYPLCGQVAGRGGKTPFL